MQHLGISKASEKLDAPKGAPALFFNFIYAKLLHLCSHAYCDSWVKIYFRKFSSFFLVLIFIPSSAFAANIGQGSAATVQKDYEKVVQSFLGENFQETERLSDKYLKKNSENASADEVSYLRALSLMKMSRFEEERPVLASLEQEGLTPEIRSQAAFSLGDSYYFALGSAQNRMQAEAYYREALRKYPQAGEAETIRKILRAPNPVATPTPSVSAPAVPKQWAVEEIPTAIVHTVQVGSFTRERNAERLLNKLLRKHYDAYILRDGQSGNFRVRAGRFASHDEAKSLGARLKKDGYPIKIFP